MCAAYRFSESDSAPQVAFADSSAANTTRARGQSLTAHAPSKSAQANSAVGEGVKVRVGLTVRVGVAVAVAGRRVTGGVQVGNGARGAGDCSGVTSALASTGKAANTRGPHAAHKPISRSQPQLRKRIERISVTKIFDQTQVHT